MNRPEEDDEEDDAEDDAAAEPLPWCIPGMDESFGSPEPQAASVSARTAAVAAAERARRGAEERGEVNISGVFPGGRTTPVARG
ncbi:hypothetical protein SAVCW2_31660 [Streptomyces avermitilis]|uniref:Uncharacterized protein n=1 Tax=Streptomyces avermitilis TaxID=33903 RepID=A0A4D4MS43_STRAX|nr:hypothetical protein SAV31267_044280 [Streptomyces avermitilis]GDY83967.1 hypothetical protein SAVCW2_31660 [Streptomyces avermitilis]